MKGSMLDITIGFIFIFIIAITLVVMNIFQTAIDPTVVFNASTQAQAAFNVGNDTLSVMDSVLLFMVMAICLGAIMSAYFAPSHPAFFILMMVITVFTAIVLVPFSNAFAGMMATPQIAAAADKFTGTVAFMQFMPVIAIIISLVVAVLMYGKRGSGI